MSEQKAEANVTVIGWNGGSGSVMLDTLSTIVKLVDNHVPK